MHTTTLRNHQIWGTVAATSWEEVTSQERALLHIGVDALELRADITPEHLVHRFIDAHQGRHDLRMFVAHFGVGSKAVDAYKLLTLALQKGFDGILYHSRSEIASDMLAACKEAGKHHIAAYHSQAPLSKEQIIDEVLQQQNDSPYFAKIGIRAHSFEDALAVIEATRYVCRLTEAPLASAVFGQQRWARLALPSAGSQISFVVTSPIVNECGTDDEQLTMQELKSLDAMRLLGHC